MFQKIESHELLQKYNFAITCSNGSVDFYISDIPVSSSLAYQPKSISEKITVLGKRLDDFISELGFYTIDVLKMDIEGIEIEVLRSCSDDLLKSIGQITTEFHDHLGCVSKSDIKAQIKRLEGLGFLHYSGYLDCYYDTLLINQSLCPISTFEYLWLRHIFRNWQGITRRFRKLLESIAKAQ